MPRKKEFNLEKKLNLPKHPLLRNALNQYKEPALRRSTIAQLRNEDFKPLWEYTDKETLALFTKSLMECSIFKTDSGLFRQIRQACCNDANLFLLFFGLSGELVEFFLSKMMTFKNHFLPDMRFFRSVLEAYRYKNDLVAIGVVKSGTLFDKKLEPVMGLAEKVLRHLLQKMPRYESGELETALYPYFSKLTKNLSDRRISLFTAHILKHLSLEDGKVKQISDRVRKRLKRKKTKKDLDIERLRKTLLPLLTK